MPPKKEANRFTPRYFGVVFGLRQKVDVLGETDCADKLVKIKDNHFEGIDSSPYSYLFNVCGEASRDTNKITDQLLTYHNGHTDVCQYNGHHFHWLIKTKIHPTRDSGWGRRALDYCRARPAEVFFAAELANGDGSALARHICTQPRQVLLATGQLVNYKTISNKTILADDAAKIKKGVGMHRMDFMTKMMAKYRTVDEGQLLERIRSTDAAEWEQWQQMIAESNYSTLYQKATTLHLTASLKQTFSQILQSGQEPLLSPFLQYFTVKKSLEIFRSWCSHQNFDEENFLKDVFAVLDRRVPKKNTICLIGPANSGKSYVVRSIKNWYQFVGEARGCLNGNNQFIWQDCLQKSVIIMEEPMCPPDCAEQFKLVFEGTETTVNVKHKSGAIMRPTPIIVTTNQPIWQYLSPTCIEAFKARMYIWRTKSCPMLANCKKHLHPLMWRELFKQHHSKWVWTTSQDIDDDDDEELLQAVQSLEDENLKKEVEACDPFAELNDQFARREAEMQAEYAQHPWFNTPEEEAEHNEFWRLTGEQLESNKFNISLCDAIVEAEYFDDPPEKEQAKWRLKEKMEDVKFKQNILESLIQHKDDPIVISSGEESDVESTDSEPLIKRPKLERQLAVYDTDDDLFGEWAIPDTPQHSPVNQQTISSNSAVNAVKTLMPTLQEPPIPASPVPYEISLD